MFLKSKRWWDLARCLVDGVADLLEVDLGHDVERGLLWPWRRRIALFVLCGGCVAIIGRLWGGCPSGQRERSVKSPATPTEVRILPRPTDRPINQRTNQPHPTDSSDRRSGRCIMARYYQTSAPTWCARPMCGGWILPASMPPRMSNHEITEFEFHISPVWRSSRPQTRGGTDGTKSRICAARSRSFVTRAGLETASATSGMTPSRHRRTSYRKTRKRPACLVPTAPCTTAPCCSPVARGTGVCSMTKRPSGTTTTRAEW